MAHFIILSDDDTCNGGRLTSSNLYVHHASATWCNHETEVSRGSFQGSIPGMPIEATQKAFGAAAKESKREETS
jgi:hypothetical protein